MTNKNRIPNFTRYINVNVKIKYQIKIVSFQIR